MSAQNPGASGPLAGEPVRVLVVDDSAFMRQALTRLINSDPSLKVVDTARDGREAIEKCKSLRPHVVTLDIEMPNIDGLTALRTIRRECAPPPAVLMCSSLTTAGSQAALQALRWGAADVIAKDASMVSAKMDDLRDELVNKLRSITGATVARAIAGLGQARGQAPDVQATPRLRADHRFKPGEFDMVLIGSSTGGPPVLETLVPMLPKGLSCPVLIAQHMPRLFTQSLSQRLAEGCALPVVHGEHGMAISPGTVYMCPGATHTHVARVGARLVLQTSDEPRAELYKPGVNVLFSTASASVSGKVLGVVLTGMGEDGAIGAGEVRARGGTVVAQDAASCVVYGMPRAVAAAGHADGVATPAQIGAMLASLSPAQAPRAAA